MGGGGGIKLENLSHIPYTLNLSSGCWALVGHEADAKPFTTLLQDWLRGFPKNRVPISVSLGEVGPEIRLPAMHEISISAGNGTNPTLKEPILNRKGPPQLNSKP